MVRNATNGTRPPGYCSEHSSRVPLYFKSYAMSGPEKIRSRGLWSHIVS